VFSIVDYVDEESMRNDSLKSQIEKNVRNMKCQLVLNGPFFASISIYKDLFQYVGNEIYQQRSIDLQGGHSVEVVGYVDYGIDDRDGFRGGYWVVKNSWGKDWPSNGDIGGYFFIRMGSNECGIEARCGNFNVNVARTTSNSRMFVKDYSEYKKYVLRI
jgi:C1A family cysteine protease